MSPKTLTQSVSPYLSTAIAMLFYITIITFQVATLSQNFKYSTEIFPYFLAITALIYCVKLFFQSIFTLSSNLQKHHQLNLLLNIALVIAQVWLFYNALGYLTETTYPIDTFEMFGIGSLLFFLQTIINKNRSLVNLAGVACAYYFGIFFLLVNFSTIITQNTSLFFQITCFIPILLEFFQVYRISKNRL